MAYKKLLKMNHHITEKQKDIIGLMQSYLGVIYLTGTYMFAYAGKYTVLSLKGLTLGLI